MQSRAITILLAVVATLSCQGDLGPIGPGGRTGELGPAGPAGSAMHVVLAGILVADAGNASVEITIPTAFGTTRDDMPAIACYFATGPFADSGGSFKTKECTIMVAPDGESGIVVRFASGPGQIGWEFRIVVVR